MRGLWKRMATLLLTAAVCAALPGCAGRAESAESAPQVTALFLNVGKADAALFWLDGKTYMIDTGKKAGADELLATLAAYGVEKIDGLVITHTDKDHVGGLKPMLKSGLQVEMLYAPRFSVDAEKDHPVAKAAEKYDVPLTWMTAGDEIAVSEGITFRALGPLVLDEENENNNSLVLRLITPEGDMLLTGDMEKTEELDLLAAGAVAQAQVLKVGHHGDGDASQKAFLYVVRPQVAVISTDSVAEPDTPDANVLRRLRELKAGIYVTQDAAVGVRVALKAGTATAELVGEKGR